jgi:hypothetical protein
MKSRKLSNNEKYKITKLGNYQIRKLSNNEKYKITKLGNYQIMKSIKLPN